MLDCKSLQESVGLVLSTSSLVVLLALMMHSLIYIYSLYSLYSPSTFSVSQIVDRPHLISIL